MSERHITATFVPNGRGKAQCAANPEFPDGKAIDMAGDQPYCTKKLPYPAPECGLWVIECNVCKLRVAVTAAGRPDDPISAKIPCKDVVYRKDNING